MSGLQLIDVLRQPDFGDDDQATIYLARPWSPEAKALVINPAPEAAGSIERDGCLFEYCLEAFIARDFLDDLVASGTAVEFSENQRCERLIQYAEADA